MPEREATCSCGALTARVSGEPRRVSVCHCLACQRRTGSAFGVQASFGPEQVTVSGPSNLFVRAADEDGEPRRYRFCPTCGATVLYDFGEGSDRINIPLGAFTDPLDPGLPAPTRSIYESRQHAWLTITSPLGERWD